MRRAVARTAPRRASADTERIPGSDPDRCSRRQDDEKLGTQPAPHGPGPGDQLPGARFTKTIRHGQKRSRARPGRGLTLPPADGAGRLVPALGAGSGGRLGPGERQPGPTGDLRVWAGQRVQGVCQERS
jgi:hypothetical protein